jgi:hypothetical protein
MKEMPELRQTVNSEREFDRIPIGERKVNLTLYISKTSTCQKFNDENFV